MVNIPCCGSRQKEDKSNKGAESETKTASDAENLKVKETQQVLGESTESDNNIKEEENMVTPQEPTNQEDNLEQLTVADDSED